MPQELTLKIPTIVAGCKFISSAIGTVCPNCKKEMLVQDVQIEKVIYSMLCVNCKTQFQVEIVDIVYRPYKE